MSTVCQKCQKRIDPDPYGPFVYTGFWLYDPRAKMDVPELDSCDVFACPHKDPLYPSFSTMTHPMGSMGEEAYEYYQPTGECPF